MLSGLSLILLRVRTARARMWSVNMKASGKTTRSQLLLVRSRSSHRGMFSKAGMSCARTTLARPQICSDLIGFLLWGMVDEPTCFLPKPSSTSAISVLCKVLISMKILSRVEATSAIQHTISACLSLCTT